MFMDMYDVIIIGAGPGGYTCAIKAAQLGGKVCIIEKDGFGGTCTQRGCIPTKFLHSIGDIVRRTSIARKEGLKAEIELDYSKVRSRMIATVNRLATGIRTLLESNSVDLFYGEARMISRNNVLVNDSILETKNIVIATGGFPICLPSFKFGKNIVSTDTILDLESLPKSIVIIGGGYSGCEFSAIFNSFGCKVHLIELQDHLLPLQIEEIGKTLEKYMRLDGIDVMTGSAVKEILDNGVMLNERVIEAEKVLVCIGRKPNINVDEMKKCGIKYSHQGINVNDQMQTSVENIFAIGDVTGLFELAHVASKQGEIAAQNIMGTYSRMDYAIVPACVFTYPEVAFVGDLHGRCGTFPLVASPKANCMGDTRGVFKVFEKDGTIVGTYIIAPHAGEIIGEAALAIKMHMKAQDMAETIHAHPTLPESLVDATKDMYSEAIHRPKKNKTGKD
jgi:dihydrolipoamide dehydrogenase